MGPYPDVISVEQCLERSRSYQQFSWIGGVLGLIAAIGSVLSKLISKESFDGAVVEAILLFVAVWTISRASALVRYQSYWHFGGVLVGAWCRPRNCYPGSNPCPPRGVCRAQFCRQSLCVDIV